MNFEIKKGLHYVDDTKHKIKSMPLGRVLGELQNTIDGGILGVAEDQPQYAYGIFAKLTS